MCCFNVNDADDKKLDGLDIAVFEFEGINSPIRCADFVPQKGSELSCITIAEPREEIPDLLSPDKARNPEPNIIKSKGKFMAEEGNFFGCDMDVHLFPGSSGSPLFFGDKLVGILTFGSKNDNIRVFQKATSFRKYIQEQ